MSAKSDPIARFWAKVSIPNLIDCWNWTASTYKNGYGQFWTGTQLTGAHRFAYTITRGEIPYGMEVCHTCDNRLCCNPSHLWLGTHQDNVADMYIKGRNNQNKGEKAAGAKFTSEQVRQIRQLAADHPDLSNSEIARMYDVAAPSIRAILLRITHKDA